MASHSLILGNIDGISRTDYLDLEAQLKGVFKTVQWKDGTLTIRSERYHDRVKNVFEKIAARISEGHFGSLLYVGNDRVACIYFGPNRFLAKEYREPEPPSWWGAA
jgi:hypothetical protein